MGDETNWVVVGALACLMTVWAIMGFYAGAAATVGVMAEAGGWAQIEARIEATQW